MKRLFLLLICVAVIFGCATGGTLRKDIESAAESATKWSDYTDYDQGTDGYLQNTDTLMVRDISDTSMAATGTQKELPYSELKLSLTNDLPGTSEAYGTGWNADTGLPQKDTVYDMFAILDTDGDGSLSDEDPTFNSLTTQSSTDPKWVFNVTDPDDTDWTIGTNADAGASSDDFFEFRQNSTEGNELSITIDPQTGDVRLYGVAGGTGGDDAYYTLLDVANPTANRTITVPDGDETIGFATDFGLDADASAGGYTIDNLLQHLEEISSGDSDTYTMQTADIGGVITNQGDDDKLTITLLEASTWYTSDDEIGCVTIIDVEGTDINIDPADGTDQILRWTNSGGDSIDGSATAGDLVKLCAVGANEIVVMGTVGTWSDAD